MADRAVNSAPSGLSPNEFIVWAMERRRQFAAGLEAKQPKLRSKSSDNEAAVITESDDSLDRPPEGDTQP